MTESLNLTVERLVAFINQTYPDVESGPGSVIHELLIKLAASLQNQQYNEILKLDQGNSIKTVLESEENSYSTIIDKIASNYNTYRSTGIKVTGKIKITVSAEGDYNLLTSSAAFIQPALGLTYFLVKDTRVSISPFLELEEIQLFEENGMYYFILDVIAEKEGEEYQLSSGTLFSLSIDGYIRNFVKAEAYGNFSSGKSPETDKQLISNIKQNISNSRFESPAGLLKKFKETFPTFQTLSVCGANDAEMMRCRQNALGISTFGKADVYVRSSLGMEMKQIYKEAKKITENTWELFILNTDVPGFYHIKSILPVINNLNLTGTLEILNIFYGTELYSNQRNNELNFTSRDGKEIKHIESRFTKYQTARVIFKYSDTANIPIGEKFPFQINTTYQPNILDMQDMLLSDQYRLACADYLVKAVIPCIVTLNIKLIKNKSSDTYESLNLKNLKKDIFNYVNSIPFGEELYASSLINLCHNYNIKRVDLPITMEGLILCPDGSSLSIKDNDVLSIPKNLIKGVTDKTTLYFIDYFKENSAGLSPSEGIGLNIV
jgi:hypothetical protein